jgi:hypothetical protein
MYLNGSSSHVGLTIVCPGTGVGIGAVDLSIVGAAGVKCGNIGGGTAEASGMSDSTGVASGMAEPTGIVEDHAEMVESSWMLSRMVEAIGIAETVEMNEAIVMLGACWVVWSHRVGRCLWNVDGHVHSLYKK